MKQVLAEFPGIWTYWPVPSGFGRSTLDCIGIACGKPFAIETKAPGGKLTALQTDEIEALTKSGAKVFVIYDYLSCEPLRLWLLSVCIHQYMDSVEKRRKRGNPS